MTPGERIAKERCWGTAVDCKQLASDIDTAIAEATNPLVGALELLIQDNANGCVADDCRLDKAHAALTTYKATSHD